MTGTLLAFPSRCMDRGWCTMSDIDEHDEFHAGVTVDLIGVHDSGDPAWWAWLVQDRGADRVSIAIEGTFDGRMHVDVQLKAWELLAILDATATPEARRALEQLLATIGEGDERAVQQ